MYRKGIILAGGTGSRLYPLTQVVNKQLLPIYDKPMIYYPLSTLMLMGVREVLVITTIYDFELYQKLLKNGNQWGIKIAYQIQEQPNGLAESFLIGKDFIKDNSVVLILGDNLFYGDQLPSMLKDLSNKEGASILACPVSDPERYGVVEFNSEKKVINIVEKPKNPKSNYVVTGIYFYDSTVVERSSRLKPSQRGELEITDLNKSYLDDNLLNVKLMSRGMAWLDTGTHESLHEASSFIKTIENRQGLKIGSPEEIAWRNKWITDQQLENLSKDLNKSSYGEYLIKLLEGKIL